MSCKNEQECEVVKVPCRVYSRVVGYYTAVNNWNVAKQHEFEARVDFDQAKINLERFPETV